MRTTVDDDDDDTCLVRLQTTCCNTGGKQVVWGTSLIFFLILFIAMGGYYSRQQQSMQAALENNTICATGTDFGTGEQLALQGVVITGAVLSMMGSFFIIFSFFAFPDLQTFPYKLIMFLSLADFFSSSTYILAVQDVGLDPEDLGSCFEDNFMCFFSAGMSQYFDFASFLWMGVISFNIYQVFVKQRGSDVVQFEKYYHLVCWGVPAFFLIIVTATDALGDAGNWCWIKRDHQLERWLCYYVPLLVVMVFNVASYVQVNKAIKAANMNQQKAFMGRMVLYIGAFLFIRCWSLLNRFVELVDGNVGVFPLMFLHSLFSPAQGVANALVYGFNKKLKDHYYHLCCGNRKNTRQVIRDDALVDNSLHDDGQNDDCEDRKKEMTVSSGNDPI